MWIGLTGGIGSGKSTIARELRQRGYEVYDTDSAAKQLIMTKDIRGKIEDLLGKEVYEDDVYRTDRVAAIVFADPDKLLQLNHIVHPAVRRDIKQRYKSSDVVFIETAILYESGMDEICDKVVAVIAPKTLRIERTMARDKKSREQVLSRIKQQMSNCQLRHKVDYVVENNGKQTIDKLTDKLIKYLKI